MLSLLPSHRLLSIVHTLTLSMCLSQLSFRPIKTSPSVRESPPVLTGPPMTFTDLFGIQTALPDDVGLISIAYQSIQ